jgi:predicted RNA-binding protein YlxR (DUF448 family)
MVLPKRSLIRIVHYPQGIFIDFTGKMAGRGAYLHDRKSCWESGLKGSLSKALKTEISLEDREILLAWMSRLPEDTTDQGEITDNPLDISDANNEDTDVNRSCTAEIRPMSA